jgi:tetratricopeptide (TPR) repeat protein
MPRARSIPLLITVLIVFSCVSTRAAEPAWLEIHSAHYTVITDAGDKKGREVALRLEQMRAVFATLLSRDRVHESRPLTVLALKSDKAYYQAAPLRQGHPIDVPGFFLPGDDQDFIVLNMSEEEAWRAVAHDFAYSLLSYNYPPAQGWFDEGLCEYFSSIRIQNKTVELGGDPELEPTVKEDLLGNPKETHPPKSLTELLGAQVWLSLPDLFTMKHDPSIRNQGSHHVLYYAESWIVMHYLIHEKKMEETGTYMGLVLAQHVPVEDAIKQAFGMSSAQMEQAVKDYFHGQTALSQAVDTARKSSALPSNSANSNPIERFPVPVSADDSVFTSKPVPEGDAQAIYGGIQMRIPERRETGLKTLQTLAATPTETDKKAEVRSTKRVGEDADQLPASAVGNALAHRILAYDYIQHGQFEEAFKEIGDAASLNPHDMWTRYYLSLAKYRMAQAKHTEMMGLSNMMLDLKAVLEWNPEMADAYDLLAVARNAGGTSTPAMQAERAAMNLSPRNETYVLDLAEIYIGNKKWEAANALLDRLKGSDNPQIASQARDLISQAGAERKYGIALNSTGAVQSKLEPQKTPFDILDEDAAKREAAENAEQENSADARSTKFARGRLLTVDCSKSPAAILTISSDSGTLKLYTGDFRSLLLIGADDFSCEWRDRQVTVNYKPGNAHEGDLVSLEMR